eukprot:CCRYP_005687-RA/>CCRYP_005687-RA protein AED:0.03 eAED:0.03 QI:282/1/1/1/0.83/0.71/7/1104/1163
MTMAINHNQWTAIGPRSYPLAFSRTTIFTGKHSSRISHPSFSYSAPLSVSKLPSRLDKLLYSTSRDDTEKSSYSPDLPYEILPFQEAVNILVQHKDLSSNEHLETGLSNEEAQKVLDEIGPNSLTPRRKKSFWELWLQQFDDGLVKILVVVALASAAFSASEVWNVLLENADESVGIGSADNVEVALSRFFSNEEIRSTVVQSFVEPAIIIAILLLNAVVGVWQDLSARSSLEALEKMQPRLATVLRYDEIEGSSNWITDFDARSLVPGDVIRLRVGDSIPADARLAELSSSTMYVDESSLTGESVSVGKLPADEGVESFIKERTINAEKKTSRDSDTATVPIQDQSAMIFSGSLVTRGSGCALVVRTGTSTQIGKIQSTLFEAQSETEERKTPLGEQLDEFGTTLSYVIGFICVVVWVTSVPRFSDSAFNTWLEGAIYYAKVSVALGVAAIPEGLPAVITLCLSLGTRRMAERNVIVRKLPSVETLGCTSVICTDKTGTLTSNQMTAVALILLESDSSHGAIEVVEHKVTGSSYNPCGSVDEIGREESSAEKHGAVKYACDIMTLCNDARLIGSNESTENIINAKDGKNLEPEPQYCIEGEPTEAALLVLVEKLGPYNNHDNPTQKKPSVLANQNFNHFSKFWERYATLEFDRRRKSMSVLCTQRETQHGRCNLFVKGAPNMILRRCSHAMLRDGTIVALDSKLLAQIESTISSIGDRALRCIGLAFKEGDNLEPQLLKQNSQYDAYLKDSSKFESIEDAMTFIGMVAIKDPPRPHVSESIDSCKEAGIRVIMITGDAKNTAVAIARDVHIFNDNEEVYGQRAFEGREFFALPESEQLDKLSTGNLVICRAEPADKQCLVKMLQSIGEIPAMTGDGVNDAPALQQASIGVAMGISGTDVAKEAADMVLVDDNFSTIVDAVEEGRCIYANMQAFINFLITCNIGEVIGVFMASILGLPQLLTPLQLLWVNLVTDGPPATALGFNPPDPNLMKRKPRSASEEILTPSLLLRYTAAGLYIGIATLGIYVSYFLDHGISLQNLSSWSTCVDKPLCDVFSDLRPPQTLALTTLVTTELLKALCTVSVNSSVFVIGPQRNPWLLLGVTVPFVLNLAIIYVPELEANFGLVPLTGDDWLKVMVWSFPIIFIDEFLKYLDSRKIDMTVNK